MGSGCPAPGVRIRAGWRPAHPETLSSTRAPPVRDAPPLVCTASRGAAGPTSRSAAPSAGAAAPPRALSPSRPLASPLPFQEGALVPRPGLSSSFPHLFPWALCLAGPRRLSLPAVSAAPAPSGSPLGPGRTARHPEAPTSPAQAPSPCPLVARVAGKMAGSVVYPPPEKAL